MRLISALLFASSALLAAGAAAQTRIYCCDDANGRRVCADYKPLACEGRAYEERDNRGFVSKIVEAPLTAEQQARRDAELAKKEEEKKKAGEERRRTLALLSTYSSEKDIISARDRALAEVDKNLKQSQQRLEEATKKKQKFESEKEFYKGKPLPAQLKKEIHENDKEIKAQQAAVDARNKEMDEIRGRFADEQKQYLALTGGKTTEQKLREDDAQDKARKEHLFAESERLRIAKETREISDSEDRANRAKIAEENRNNSRRDTARRAEGLGRDAGDRSNIETLNEPGEKRASEERAQKAEALRRRQVQ